MTIGIEGATLATGAPDLGHTLTPLGDGAAQLHRPAGFEQQSLVERGDQAFAHLRNLRLLVLEPEQWAEHPEWTDLIAEMGAGRVLREAFYQRPWHWLRHAPASPAETPFDPARGIPVRPPQPAGEVYERFDPRLGRRLTLRVAELSRDTDRLTRWMNLPRVAEFWEQAWSRDALAEFLQQRLADPHTIPLIGEFDGQAFGYFEIYWAGEDRLAPYYPWAPFDRGLHLLVGEEDVRGPRFVDAWLSGLQHYAYLSEPRTTRIVLEPRHDNERLFRHLERLGLSAVREFDFPHKRATLVMGHRGRFFQEVL